MAEYKEVKAILRVDEMLKKLCDPRLMIPKALLLHVQDVVASYTETIPIEKILIDLSANKQGEGRQQHDKNSYVHTLRSSGQFRDSFSKLFRQEDIAMSENRETVSQDEIICPMCGYEISTEYFYDMATDGDFTYDNTYVMNAELICPECSATVVVRCEQVTVDNFTARLSRPTDDEDIIEIIDDYETEIIDDYERIIDDYEIDM